MLDISNSMLDISNLFVKYASVDNHWIPACTEITTDKDSSFNVGITIRKTAQIERFSLK